MEFSTKLLEAYKPIPWEEQLKLFEKRGTDEWPEIRERIFFAYTPLIVNRASHIKQVAAPKATHNNPLYDDLISDQAVLLLRAIDVFDISKGTRLMTYVYSSFMSHAFKNVLRYLCPVTLPQSYTAVDKLYSQLLNTTLTTSLLEVELYENSYEGGGAEEAIFHEEVNQAHELIDQILSGPEREAVFGLLAGENGSETGRRLGISRQAVSTARLSAIRKLQEKMLTASELLER